MPENSINHIPDEVFDKAMRSWLKRQPPAKITVDPKEIGRAVWKANYGTPEGEK